MKKQKICIIGDGLSGLSAALILSKLDIEVDFVIKSAQKNNINDPRTTAISPSNYNFISKYLNTNDLNTFWGCKSINLFYEKSEKLINFLNFSESNKNILYIARNNNLKKILFKKIESKKNIRIINSEIKKIDIKKTQVLIKNKFINYDLILLCLGKNSKIIAEFLGKRIIEQNIKEIAFTSVVKHNSKILDPKQYFLKEGPLAILPIDEKTFSFVWSVSSTYKNINVEKFVNLKLNKILGKNVKVSFKKPMIFPISFKFNSNFSQYNSIVLGDGSYNVHPVAGQGFNLILRDIIYLFQLIENNQSLGLQIKDSLIFKKFVKSRKPENLLFGLGISFTNNFFKYNKNILPVKEFVLKDINNFKFLKQLSMKISDKGIFQSLK